jgi:hypothetical protein
MMVAIDCSPSKALTDSTARSGASATPRQGHKLTSDVLDFAAQLRASDPSVRPPALAAAIQKRFDITAHPRSIERALGRQEKKRR